MSDKITQSELRRMFGENMPIAALMVIQNEKLTLEEVRNLLAAISTIWDELQEAYAREL